MTTTGRARLRYVTLAATTIVVGLVVHLADHPLHSRLRDLLGDALWAVMITWWVSAIVPDARVGKRASLALLICFVVEFSQLIDTPSLNRLRGTILGQLVLGSGFDVRDLVAYAVGVLLASTTDQASMNSARRAVRE